MSKKILSKIEYVWDFYFSFFFINATRHGRHITYLENKYGREYTWNKFK